MEIHDETISVLNDLIVINHDRVEGYEKAKNETSDTDVDLKSLFQEMADQSNKYAEDLSLEVSKLGGDPTAGTTISGKIYRVWMDLKAAISGKDRETILGSCEYGEEVIQRAYEMALETDAFLSPLIKSMITSQKDELNNSYNVIKKFRQMQELQ